MEGGGERLQPLRWEVRGSPWQGTRAQEAFAEEKRLCRQDV